MHTGFGWQPPPRPGAPVSIAVDPSEFDAGSDEQAELWFLAAREVDFAWLNGFFLATLNVMSLCGRPATVLDIGNRWLWLCENVYCEQVRQNGQFRRLIGVWEMRNFT